MRIRETFTENFEYVLNELSRGSKQKIEVLF